MTIQRLSNDINQSNKELSQPQISLISLFHYYQLHTEISINIPMPLDDNEINNNNKHLKSHSTPVSPKNRDSVNDLKKTIRKKSSTLLSSSSSAYIHELMPKEPTKINTPSPPPPNSKVHNPLRRSALYSPPKDALKVLQPIESKIEGEKKEIKPVLPPIKENLHSSIKYEDSKQDESKA